MLYPVFLIEGGESVIISFFGSLFSLFFPSFLLSFSLSSVRPLSFNCYYSLSLLILFIIDLFLFFPFLIFRCSSFLYENLFCLTWLVSFFFLFYGDL